MQKCTYAHMYVMYMCTCAYMHICTFAHMHICTFYNAENMHTFGTIGQCHMYAHCNLTRWCLSGHSWLCTLIHLSLNPRGVGPAAHFQHRVAQSNTDSRLSILLPGVHAAIGQILEGLFSAVSKPMFASKFSLESSRRDLHNAVLRTVLESILIP